MAGILTKDGVMMPWGEDPIEIVERIFAEAAQGCVLCEAYADTALTDVRIKFSRQLAA